MNQLAQNPTQPWVWQPTMDSQAPLMHHQHHYFQLEQNQQQQQQPNFSREHMFEKPLTPSDVGKLNRLVIPKQHAEKYFPLDSESGEKGLHLSFEDELGKLWKFRYSYWTSSQSYVLTKGWSRYVKEKKLDAGDVVLFHRARFGRSADDRLFIGWRRRGSNDAVTGMTAATAAFYGGTISAYPARHYYMNSVNLGEQAGSGMESSPTSVGSTTGNPRRLRLFGVNLECGPDQPEPPHLGSGSWNQFMPTNASTSQF